MQTTFDRDRFHLADRFDDLSKKYPALKLVALSAPDDIESLSPGSYMQDYDEGEPGEIHPYIKGRYAPQVLKTPTNWCCDVEYDNELLTMSVDDPRIATQDDYDHPDRVVWQMSLPKLSFPQWTFQPNTAGLWVNGIWSIWLYRDFGRDPSASSEVVPNPPDQAACLAAYGIVTNEAGMFLRRYQKELRLPKWLIELSMTDHDPLDYNEFGYGGIRWLMAILPKCNGKYSANEVVVNDVGLYSGKFLRDLNLPADREDSAEISPSAVIEDGLSEDGRTLRWGGKLYLLSTTAAGVVAKLVESYQKGFPYLSDTYLRDSETGSEMRHIVRDNGLSEIVIKQRKDNGAVMKDMWGLIDPKKVS